MLFDTMLVRIYFFFKQAYIHVYILESDKEKGAGEEKRVEEDWRRGMCFTLEGLGRKGY